MAQEPRTGAERRFCSQCGQRLEPGSNFCGNCGAAAIGQQTPAPVANGGPKTTSHIKYRNMLMQVFLVVITLGIYIIYWYYVTLKELYQANGRPAGSGMWTFLSVVPIVQYFAYWHYANEYAEFVDEKYPAIGIFVVWILFSPAAWFLIQSDLNRAAKGEV